jgi:hypothetical protein
MHEEACPVFGRDLGCLFGLSRRRSNRKDQVAPLEFCNMSMQDALIAITKKESVDPLKQIYAVLSVDGSHFIETSLFKCRDDFIELLLRINDP